MASSKRRVWLKKRKNPKKKDGSPGTVSFTLQWRDEETGKERFESLGPSTTEEEAEKKRAEKEVQLNRRTTEVRVEAITSPRLSLRLEDICGPRARKEELDFPVQVQLPELGITETPPMRVPLEILPFLYARPRHPIEEELCHQLLLGLLEDATLFLDQARLEGVSNADDNGRWSSELAAWRKRLIQHLYTIEFGGHSAKAAPPPSDTATTPITKPVVEIGPLPSSYISKNAFVMPDEAEPDDPRRENRMHRGQISSSDEEDVDDQDESERPFDE